MMNRDRTFVSILINCTAPTELDMVKKKPFFIRYCILICGIGCQIVSVLGPSSQHRSRVDRVLCFR